MLYWIKEPKAVNDKPSYVAHAARGDYRIIPVPGGFRIHYRLIEGSTWACGECCPKLGLAKVAAELLDADLRKGWIPPTICPEFRAWLAEVGKPSGKTAGDVYDLWREYCDMCHDQSALKSEFLEWYKDQLRPLAPVVMMRAVEVRQ